MADPPQAPTPPSWLFTWRRPLGRQLRRVVFGVIGLLALALVFDAPFTRAVTHWPAGERAFFGWLTQWGESAWVLVPTLLVWAGLLAARVLPLGYAERWAARAVGAMSGFIFVGVGLPGLVAAVLKRAIGRGRPPLLDQYGTLVFHPMSLFDWTWQGFPSGHATTSFALAVVLVVLFGRRLAPFVFALAGLIALSRNVTGVHYLSDTVAGAVLGSAGAWWIADRFARRRWVLEVKDGVRRNRMLAPVGRLFRRRQAAAA